MKDTSMVKLLGFSFWVEMRKRYLSGTNVLFLIWVVVLLMNERASED